MKKTKNKYPKILAWILAVGIASIVLSIAIITEIDHDGSLGWLSLLLMLIGYISALTAGGLLLIYFAIKLFSKGSDLAKEAGKEVSKNLKKSATSFKPLLKTQKKDMEDFVRLLEVNTDEELAEHLIFSTFSREENPILTEEFLSNLAMVPANEVHKVKAQLQMINLQLKNDVSYAHFMAGNVIWIMTLRSIESFEHLLLAKRMWKELKRGQKHIPAKLDELGLEVPKDELNRFYFIPKI